MNQPKFKHDCEACEFLGIFNYDGNHCDFYLCGKGYSRSVIARFGNDGPEYASTPFLGCVELTSLDWAVLGRGIELSSEEKDKLILKLLRIETGRMKFRSHKYNVVCNIPDEEKTVLGKNNWIWSD
jgi:hypothetical protein